MIYIGDVCALPFAADSIDLIVTDPPYGKKSIGLYADLAEEAARVLRPGGALITMVGGAYLDQILSGMSASGLTYFWAMALNMNTGRNTYLNHWRLLVRHKLLVVYGKGSCKPRVGGLQTAVNGKGPAKRYHHWGQDVSSIAYYIDHFSEPGQIVLDPMTGGGSTSVACDLLGRKSISGDIDPDAIQATIEHRNGARAPNQLGLFQ